MDDLRLENAPLGFPLPDLPLDIITKILLKLPVKDLGRYKCVSKTWLSLISDRQFIKAHLKVSSEDKELVQHKLVFKSDDEIFLLKGCSLSSLVHGNDIIEMNDLHYPMKQPGKHVVFSAYCNGLVCLRVDWKDLFLCNFSTGEFRQLPDSSFKKKSASYDSYPTAFGFGYDERTDDYKITCFSHSPLNLRFDSDNSGVNNEGKLYSLRDDSWRSIEGFRGASNGCHGLFFKGKLHWMVMENEEWRILSFDMERENYERIEGPKLSIPRRRQLEFKSLNTYEGCLTMLRDFLAERVADFWVMKEYGKEGSWSKIASFAYGNEIHGGLCPKIICVLEKGKILLHFWWSDMVLFDPEDNSFEYLGTSLSGRYHLIDFYIESLISFKNYGRLGN